MQSAHVPAKPIQVYLVDDHPVTLRGLRAYLGECGIEIAGEATTGKEAVREILRLQPEVVLLDIRLPDLDGLAVLRKVRPHAPNTAILLFTAFEEPVFLIAAVVDGAAGFALKGDSGKDLLSLIRHAAEGEDCLPRSYWEPLLRKLEEKRRTATAEVLKDWSEREIQILRFMAQGCTNKSIAGFFDLPLDKVRFAVRSIFKKLGVSDRTRAVSEAYTRGILAIPDFKD